MRRLALILLVTLSLGLATVLPVGASPPPSGITVTPAIETITFSATQASAHFTTTLTNNTSTPLTVAISTSDFTYLNQNGAIQFLTGGGAASNPHGLATAVHPSPEIVLLQPGTTHAIEVDVTGVASLAPGGHYGALIYRAVDASSASGNVVSLKPAVSTLIFVSTAGQGTQQLQLTSPITSWLRGALPSQLDLVFANTGNTQTAVHGVAQLFAPSGKLISQGVINSNSGLILPGLERLFPVSLASVVGGAQWPGVYQLEILYRHDGQATYARHEERFLLINQPLLIGLGLLVVIMIGLLLRRLSGARHYVVES